VNTTVAVRKTVGAEVVATVAEHGSQHLRSPMRRLAAPRRIYPPADYENDYLIGSFGHSGALAIGESYEVTVNVTFPAQEQPNRPRVKICLNAGGPQVEPDPFRVLPDDPPQTHEITADLWIVTAGTATAIHWRLPRAAPIIGMLADAGGLARAVLIVPMLLVRFGRSIGFEAAPDDGRFWGRQARRVMRHPWLWLLGPGAVLVAVGLPFRAVDPGRIDDRVLPVDAPARAGADPPSWGRG
jgi:hypothetical protein